MKERTGRLRTTTVAVTSPDIGEAAGAVGIMTIIGTGTVAGTLTASAIMIVAGGTATDAVMVAIDIRPA